MIKKNKQLNPYGQRKGYMDTSQAAGKRFPSLSYSNFLTSKEHILDARDRYLKTRNYYYSGWSMDTYWDNKLKNEEKVIRQAAAEIGIEILDEVIKIDKSLQDRLRKAALNEVDNDEEKSGSKKKSMSNKLARRHEGPYLPIIFCWQKMGTTTGYPPRELEQAKDLCDK